MVAQTPENEWGGGGSSRTGSMLSLDGRRPPVSGPVKTPPSYYDAVRSRHSLSQQSPEKQEKSINLQQIKYNSLPRPLPQRYPQAANTTNGGQPPLRNVWPVDDKASSNPPYMRQQYDSPPKPANRVPLQLQVHQERKMEPQSPQKEFLRAHQRTDMGIAPRGNAMNGIRKDCPPHLRPDIRPPPPVPGRRPLPPRGGPASTVNSVQKRDSNHNPGLLRHCNSVPFNEQPQGPRGYPPPTRPIINGSSCNYEPRYSKSGKLCARVQESRPMPPPIVMLRTGPLGTYPDPETLKRAEMERQAAASNPMRTLSQGDVSQEIFVDTNTNSYAPMIADHLAIPYRIPQMSPKKDPRGMFDGNYQPPNGTRKDPACKPGSSDFKSLTLPVMPRTLADNGNLPMDYRNYPQEHAPTFYGNAYNTMHIARPSPSLQSLKESRFAYQNGGDDVIYANQQSPFRSTNGREPTPGDRRVPSLSDGSSPVYENSVPSVRNGMKESSYQSENLYANHFVTNGKFNSPPSKIENQQLNRQLSPPCLNGKRSNGVPTNHHQLASTNLDENHPGNHQPFSQNSTQQTGIQNFDKKHNLVGNNHQAIPPHFESRKGNSLSNLISHQDAHQQQRQNLTSNPHSSHELSRPNFVNKHQRNNSEPSHDIRQRMDGQHPPQSICDSKSGAKNPRSDRRNTHPPPVAQKALPQPSEMVVLTETRGWNGQASSTFAKDVIKPTPRLPRLPNGVLASNAQLATVPAFQCVINELTSHPLHHTSTESAAVSASLEYDSLPGSSREFCKRPTKSDSACEQRVTSENCAKPRPLLSASMTSLCSDASSSVSTRQQRRHEISAWDRLNGDCQQRKDKDSVFTASPWDREEKEKLHHDKVQESRRARDQEISYLESLPDPTGKQQEWLRILRLEKEFQWRAEQEPDEDEEGSVCSETSDTDSDKISNFPKDKLTVIPNERISLKLLDELLDNSSKSTNGKSSPERETALKTPSAKHFIPLDLAIPDNDLQPACLPLTNNILKISSTEDGNDCRSSNKPPIPAPRPSKTFLATPDSQRSSENNLYLDSNISSLSKLDISDSSAFFCSTENEVLSSRNTPHDDWMIDVPIKFPDQQNRPYSNEDGLNLNSVEYNQRDTPLVEAKIYHNGIQASEETPLRLFKEESTDLKFHQNGSYHQADALLMDSKFRQRDEESFFGTYKAVSLRDLKTQQNGEEAMLRDQKLNGSCNLEYASFVNPKNGEMEESAPMQRKLNGGYGGPREQKMRQRLSDPSRIYENIKPADFQYLRTQTVTSGSYSSHTLPKSTTTTSNNNSALQSNAPRTFEKKFPAMGVSSTLTKKANGYVPSDADILPSLYASYKAAQNGHAKEVVPSDLVGKSPEFKKMWISRPEKLTFQDKIRKFSLQAGEDDAPRDRIKNSKAQREIENKFTDAQKQALSLKAAEL